jgi:very-short-patch-repair endonuclease
MPQRQVTAMLEEGERLRIFDLRAIEDVLTRSPGHRGRASLIASLGATIEEAQHTKLHLERLLLDVCREAGLPLPVFNTVVEGYVVDAHWPGTMVIVELDSWRFHRTRAAFERDRARDLHLKLKEYNVLRITWRQLTERPREVIRTLRALLDSCRTPRALDPGAPARALP